MFKRFDDPDSYICMYPNRLVYVVECNTRFAGHHVYIFRKLIVSSLTVDFMR